MSRPTPELHDAALRVLEVRLGVVRDYLGAALAEPDRDPEHVHQLRRGDVHREARLRGAGFARRVHAIDAFRVVQPQGEPVGALQQRRALCCRTCTPGGPGFIRRLNGTTGFRALHRRHAREQLTAGRVDDVQRRTVIGANPLPVYIS